MVRAADVPPWRDPTPYNQVRWIPRRFPHRVRVSDGRGGYRFVVINAVLSKSAEELEMVDWNWVWTEEDGSV